MGALKIDPRTIGQARRKAKRLGISLEELLSRRADGFHVCLDCRQWLPATREYFTRARGNWRGLELHCKPCIARRRRHARRIGSSIPLDAPPRSGRRPYSDSDTAQYQRRKREQMSDEERETFMRKHREAARRRYHENKRKAMLAKAAPSQAANERALEQLQRCVRAAQSTVIRERSVEQSALLLKAQRAGLIKDCGYHA